MGCGRGKGRCRRSKTKVAYVTFLSFEILKVLCFSVFFLKFLRIFEKAKTACLTSKYNSSNSYAKSLEQMYAPPQNFFLPP